MNTWIYLLAGLGLFLFALILLWMTGNKPGIIPDFPFDVMKAAKSRTLDSYLKPEKRTKRKPKIEKVISFPIKISKNDLNYDIARNAYHGTSFTPEKRAEEEQREYIRAMHSMYENLKPYAKNDEQKQVLKEELARYREGYLQKKHDLLYRRSGIYSSMITGPSNFPVARMRKKNEIDRRKTQEFYQWNTKVKTSIKRKINRKITEQEKQTALYSDIVRDLKTASTTEFRGKKVPSYVRTNAKSRIVSKLETLVYNGQKEEVEGALKVIDKTQSDIGKDVFTKRHKLWQFPEKAEKFRESAKSQTGVKEIMKFKGGRIVNNFDDERIQISFDEKPSDIVLRDLNGSGWRWSRYNKVWQRKNTPNAEYSAKHIISSNIVKVKVS